MNAKYLFVNASLHPCPDSVYKYFNVLEAIFMRVNHATESSHESKRPVDKGRWIFISKVLRIHSKLKFKGKVGNLTVSYLVHTYNMFIHSYSNLSPPVRVFRTRSWEGMKWGEFYAFSTFFPLKWWMWCGKEGDKRKKGWTLISGISGLAAAQYSRSIANWGKPFLFSSLHHSFTHYIYSFKFE